MDEMTFNEQLTKVAVDCCDVGVDATLIGIRTLLDQKGVFDSGNLSRAEFELAGMMIQGEVSRIMRDTIEAKLGGDSK